MAAFELKHKEFKKAGFWSYTYMHPLYSMVVHVVKERGKNEILYPVSVKAVGNDIDIIPDAHIMSGSQGELVMPPNVSFERFSAFKKQLDALPDVLEQIKDIIKNIEEGEV